MSKYYKQNKNTNILSAATCIVAALFCIRCSSSPSQTGPNLVPGTWAYTPDFVELHPLSRYTEQNDGDDIVVHVEFKDGDRYACRGTGTLIVALYTKNMRFIEEQVIDLQNASTNRQHFDPITRTYQVRFENVPEDVPTFSLQAVYEVMGNPQMKSTKITVSKDE